MAHQRQSVWDDNRAVEQIYQEQRAKGMSEDMSRAYADLNSAYFAESQALDLIELMEKIKSGGLNRIQDYWQDIWGTRPVSETEAVNLMKGMGLMILERFTGPKSDDEREFALTMGPSFVANAEGNIALTQLLLDSIRNRIALGKAAQGGVDAWTTHHADQARASNLRMTDADVIDAHGGKDKVAKFGADNGLSEPDALEELRVFYVNKRTSN